jgi:aquaporin Z
MAETPALSARLGAEFLGTFWLVFAGCGTAVLAAGFPDVGVGFLGVALAFGLAVLTAIYALGHVSGGHFNPAVTIGLTVARRFPAKDVVVYVATQVIAAVLASAVLLAVASGKDGFDRKASGFAANGFADHSPGGYTLLAGLLVEIVLTAFFVYVILGATDGRAPVGFAPIAIGLALTVTNLVAIPVTNASINPARSTGPALFTDPWALEQLWLFWVAPIVGALIAGGSYAAITGQRVDEPIEGKKRGR